MSPLMSPPLLTLCPPALVPPMCKRPRENPANGYTFAKYKVEEVHGGVPGKTVYQRLRLFSDI